VAWAVRRPRAPNEIGQFRSWYIERWGMTEEEARGASRERPATLSVMLRHDGQRYGVLYVDSVQENAFGTDASASDVARALENHPITIKLSRAVAEVLEPLRLAAPFLEVAQ